MQREIIIKLKNKTFKTLNKKCEIFNFYTNLMWLLPQNHFKHIHMLFNTYYCSHHLDFKGKTKPVKNMLESGRNKRPLRDRTNSEVNNYFLESFSNYQL
jgi:hypothetical protein